MSYSCNDPDFPPATSSLIDFEATARIARAAGAAAIAREETSELRAFALAIVQAGTLLCEREDGEKLVARAFAYLSSQFPDVPANGQ